MIVGAAIYVVGLAIMAMAGGTTALLVSGAFIGIALSCTASSLAMTATARAVPEERRSKTLGLVSAAGSLGTLLVPLATQAILAHEAWQRGRLARRALPEAHPARAAVHPARRRLYRLFHDAADPGLDARLRGRDGDVVAQRCAPGQRPRRRDVRHPLHGDPARHRLCDAPGR